MQKNESYMCINNKSTVNISSVSCKIYSLEWTALQNLVCIFTKRYGTLLCLLEYQWVWIKYSFRPLQKLIESLHNIIWYVMCSYFEVNINSPEY